MPITEGCMYAVLYGGMPAQEAIKHLLNRPRRGEHTKRSGCTGEAEKEREEKTDGVCRRFSVFRKNLRKKERKVLTEGTSPDIINLCFEAVSQKQDERNMRL